LPLIVDGDQSAPGRHQRNGDLGHPTQGAFIVERLREGGAGRREKPRAALRLLQRPPPVYMGRHVHGEDHEPIDGVIVPGAKRLVGQIEEPVGGLFEIVFASPDRRLFDQRALAQAEYPVHDLEVVVEVQVTVCFAQRLSDRISSTERRFERGVHQLDAVVWSARHADGSRSLEKEREVPLLQLDPWNLSAHR
jgi:hypothetical protein